MGSLALFSVLLAICHPAVGDDSLAEEALRLARDAPAETFALELSQWEALERSRDPQWVYRRHALWIAQLPEGQWEVRSRAQGALSVEQLAVELRDEEQMASLRLGGEFRRLHFTVQTALGATAWISAIKLWDAAAELLPDRSAYRADPRNCETWDGYQAARDNAAASWDVALAAIPQDQRMKAEDRSWTGVFLAISGTALLASLPLLRRDMRQKRLQASRHFSMEEIRTLLDERNARLAMQLVHEAARMKAAQRALPVEPLPQRPDSPAAPTMGPR